MPHLFDIGFLPTFVVDEPVRSAIADLPRVLARDGAAFFECDPPQVDAIATLLSSIGTTGVHQDLAGLDRVVSMHRG